LECEPSCANFASQKSNQKERFRPLCGAGSTFYLHSSWESGGAGRKCLKSSVDIRSGGIIVRLTPTEVDIFSVPVRKKLKSISVRIKVGVAEEIHVLGLIELHGGQYVANPYYRGRSEQVGMIRLDPRRIEVVAATPETGNYSGILLEISRRPGEQV
jgi:hypothetical protein